MYFSSTEIKHVLLVEKVTNWFSLFVIVHLFSSIRCLGTVHLVHIIADCTVSSSSITKYSSSRLLFYPSNPLHFSNSYVCICRKLCFKTYFLVHSHKFICVWDLQPNDPQHSNNLARTSIPMQYAYYVFQTLPYEFTTFSVPPLSNVISRSNCMSIAIPNLAEMGIAIFHGELYSTNCTEWLHSNACFCIQLRCTIHCLLWHIIMNFIFCNTQPQTQAA